MRLKERIGVDSLVYGIYAAIIPLNMILNFTGNTINKQIGLLAGGLILFFLVRKHIHIVKEINKGLFLYLGYSFLSIIWSVSYDTTFSSFVTLTSLYFIYAVAKLREFNSKEEKVITLLMAITASIMPAYMSVNKAVSYSRGTFTSSAGTADQNGLALNMAFAAIVIFPYFFNAKTKVMKYLSLCCFIVITIGVFITGSRGGILALFCAIFYYLFKAFPQLIKNKKIWLYALILVFGVFIAYRYLSTNLNDAIWNRFIVSSIVEDRGSGRINIWKNAIRIIGENPWRMLFGYGYGTQKIVFEQFYGNANSAHNVFFQLLVEVGIIGTCLYIYGIIYFWQYAKKRNCIIAQSLILSLCIGFMLLAFATNKGCWNVFLLVVCLSKNCERKICQEKRNYYSIQARQ